VPVGGRAQARQPPDRALLIRNVRLFDGMSASLRDGHLLVSGKKIAEVSSGAVQPPQGAQIIDGGHRVLMAGLSDAHWHMVFALNTSRVPVSATSSCRSGVSRGRA
jgi:imidazolonepropionase-like amidohydrolase